MAMDLRRPPSADDDGELGAAPVLRVSARVRVVSGRPVTRPAPDESPATSAWDPALSELLGPLGFLRGPILLFLWGVPAASVLGDVAWAVVILATTAAALRIIDRGVAFTFADGLIGPRQTLGWPRGVQEDDDVRWSWRQRLVPHVGTDPH